MAAVHNNIDAFRTPPSPSLTNPDMILPYDPRLRDSMSTENTESSGGPDITSLNDQMAMSLNSAHMIKQSGWKPNQHIAKQSRLPIERSAQNAALANPPVPDTDPQGNSFNPDKSFLNLSRFSTISGLPPSQMDEEDEVPETNKEQIDGASAEVAARNDFARAEEILANAKKRLTAMEGNLTRARSLSVSRSASVASGFPEDRSSWRTSDGSAHGNGWAISAAKLRQNHRKPGGSAANHTRVFSENSVPSQNLGLSERANKQDMEQRRSSSAMGSFAGDGLNASGYYDSYQRGGMGRLEPLREDEQLSPSPDHRANSRTGLDRLQDLPAKARSNVQLRDLREQMQDLKDKLSVLKQRTREDTMHRRSMQYLKSPSPFTDAEAWRGTPPRNGSRQSTHRSQETPRSDEVQKTTVVTVETVQHTGPKVVAVTPGSANDSDALGSPGTMINGPRGVIEDALTSLDEKLSKSPHMSPKPNAAMHRPTLSGSIPLPPSVFEKSAFEPWSPHSERAEILSMDDIGRLDATVTEDKNKDRSSTDISNIEKSESSEGTEPSSDTAALANRTEAEVSHEDRPDAFDYENFVISSTMGTYERSKQRSLSSSGSTSTIGPEDFGDSESPALIPGAFTGSVTDARPYHARNPSGGSSTSLDTFLTAESRSASRLQAESRQALREAASRDMLADMPGAFVNSQAPTPVPSSEPFQNESAPQSKHLRSDSYASSDGTERPNSFTATVPSGRQAYANTYSVASNATSTFTSTNVAPAIDPARDPDAIAARTSILRTLLVHTSPQFGSRSSDVATISESDEALLRSVIEGLQRACGQLVWSGSLYGNYRANQEVLTVRQKLDAARIALEDANERIEEDDDDDDTIEDDDDDANHSADQDDSWFDGEAEERFVAL